MSLRAVVPGPSPTVQDGGRIGFRAFGVPLSGPFDGLSAAIANALVGNGIGTAILELNGFGGTYEAESSLALGLAGADMAATVVRRDGSSRRLAIPCATTLRDGDRLILGGSEVGFRLYLAATGGWLMPVILGSRADERAIVGGDLLPAKFSRTSELGTKLGTIEADDSPVRFVDGPDGQLPNRGLLSTKGYQVGRDSNRLGLRLEGERIAIEVPADRRSSPVVPGAIQVADGQPIVLGPACGTMGGYPHVGTVLSADLGRIGQARPGAWLRFRRVEVADAWAIDEEHRRRIEAVALRLRAAVEPFVTTD